MDRLKERLNMASHVHRTFADVIVDDPSSIERDAAIQRFEYTVETTWKACQRYLDVIHGHSCASPKDCIRAAREVGLLTDAQSVLALEMIDARNLTSHTYNEVLAVRIYRKFPDHAKLLDRWLENMWAGIEP